MLYSNFIEQVWYTPKSQQGTDKPARFLIKTIPYRFTSLPSLSNISGITVSISGFLLRNCIIDYQNIYTELPKEHVLQDLEQYIGRELFQELIDKILELWAPSEAFLSTLMTTVELMLDPRFTDGTWHCYTCQKRGLDKQRNCPLIEGVEHLDPMFKLPFMGETVMNCPVAEKDEALGQLILEGHNFRDINQVPEQGGMGDQPIIFVIGTQHLAERLKHFKRQAEEEALKNTRH